MNGSDAVQMMDKNIFLFVLSKYNLFVQELKKYRITNHITFLRGVSWSGMEDKKNLVMYSNVGSKIEWHGG